MTQPAEKLSARLRAKFAKYYPRERLPGEALPRTISVMSGEYKPQASAPMRPGADDHLACKSAGYLT